MVYAKILIPGNNNFNCHMILILLIKINIKLLHKTIIIFINNCKEGEVYNECASACEPNCTDQNYGCIKICMEGKCQCKEGYVRNENNECIPKEECPKPTIINLKIYTNISKNFNFKEFSDNCKEGEIFKSCASACEPNCTNYKNIFCILVCMPGKCQCKEGYVRNENNECIPKEECFKIDNPYIYPLKCGEGKN
ncbi:hypothetical protein Mgra_00003791 [Meloidogyne graminicola]|uniref:TIL domain-containing protein n=1 Tax=Meloidogyne graminicola TaxID=189291 RepID=A0A8S9ZUH9_9BILA|nr:hypothetical protein Mgra_00003791 [Meloidogyne graminicola]